MMVKRYDIAFHEASAPIAGLVTKFGGQPARVTQPRWPLGASTGGNKIGGSPAFLQGPEYPVGGPWKLVLQLESADAPFEVSFGDAGLGYTFISKDGESGRFPWQGA